MKRFAFLIMALALVAFADLAPTWAQPAMTAPAPTTTAPAAMPATAPTMASPAPDAMASQPSPVATPKPAEAPAPAMASEPAMAPTAAPAKAPEPVPEWKTATFWLTKVVSPILGVIFAILVAFGVLKQTWLKWLKEKKAVEIADKVVSQFENYAKGTKANWDDILAQVLKAVVTRVGELTGDMEVQVRKVVEERKEQAEKKNGNDTPPA